MIKILFICHGNICRSTMAESIMCWLVKKNHLQGAYCIASAAWRKVGTTSNHHAPYDQGYTRATMA